MNALITHNIKVSVRSFYKPEYSKPNQQHFVHAYKIIIENKSEHPIQVMTRHWKIFDSVEPIKNVDGEGVVGEKPIIEPGGKFEYVSGCHLKSEIGYMRGFYNVLNPVTKDMLIIAIPKFTLQAGYKLN